MNAKSIKGTTISEISGELDGALADGFQPTLAIVFLSIDQDRDGIRTLLDKHNVQIFGVTTNGEFTGGTPENNSSAILLVDLNQEAFKILFDEYPEGNYREVSAGIASKALEHFKQPAFLLGLSSPDVDGEEILHGLEDVVGKDVNAFGAAAGDNLAFKETIVFTNDRESRNGMICVVLDEKKVEIGGIATCGWKAVGTTKTVTKSEGNHVYTIDGEPALDITTRFGGLENISPDNADLQMELAANFPLQLLREKGDPVMRPGLVVDWSDHSFYTSGSVPQGSKVRFSIPPDFDVMDKVVKGLEKLKLEQMPEADALVVFSCAGRLLAFGPLVDQELEGINNVWKIPMVGMFSNAELARATGGNLEMHNITTCCVALREK